MAIVIVGGHSRNIGKTSVVAGLIAAMSQMSWTAVKITQFGHGICSVSHEPCDCALLESEHTWSLDEERERDGRSDTARFLQAGAARSLWLRTRQGMLAEAMPALRHEMTSAENVILESNSVLRFLQPDVYLSVLDPQAEDFKESAREFLDRAHAFVVTGTLQPGQKVWAGVSRRLIAEKPMFRVSPPNFMTEELAGFVRGRVLSRMVRSAAR